MNKWPIWATLNERLILSEIISMIKSATVRARVNPKLKHDVENVLSKLGLSMSEAIEIFMSQIKLNKGLPFDVRIPNRVTRKTLDDADKGKGLHKAKDADDLFNQLGI